MFNLTDSVTVSSKSVVGVDSDTGTPVYDDVAAMVNQPCAFAVLSSADHLQAWGDGATPTNTDTVTASLRLPSWAPDLEAADRHTVTVSGYAGSWRVTAKRPGQQWTTYLLQHN